MPFFFNTTLRIISNEMNDLKIDLNLNFTGEGKNDLRFSKVKKNKTRLNMIFQVLKM